MEAEERDPAALGRGGAADRRDREPGHPQPRDHVLLLASCRRDRRANRRQGANWCTYATWASRQAGRTIRGEDLLEQLGPRLGNGPLAAASRSRRSGGGCCAAASSSRDTRLGRLTAELHTPFDAFERGERSGRARQPQGVRGDRPRVRALPRRSARRIDAARLAGDPPVPRRAAAGRPARRAALPAPGVRALRAAALRERPEGARRARRAREPRDRLPRADAAPARDPGGDRRRATRPSRTWASRAGGAVPVRAAGRRLVRRPAAAVLGVVAVRRAARGERARPRGRSPTRSWSSRSPAACSRSGRTSTTPYPTSLRETGNADLAELLARYEPVPPAPDDCGATRLVGARPADALHRRTCSARFHAAPSSPSRRSRAEQVASLRPRRGSRGKAVTRPRRQRKRAPVGALSSLLLGARAQSQCPGPILPLL